MVVAVMGHFIISSFSGLWKSVGMQIHLFKETNTSIVDFLSCLEFFIKNISNVRVFEFLEYGSLSEVMYSRCDVTARERMGKHQIFNYMIL